MVHALCCALSAFVDFFLSSPTAAQPVRYFKMRNVGESMLLIYNPFFFLSIKKIKYGLLDFVNPAAETEFSIVKIKMQLHFTVE